MMPPAAYGYPGYQPAYAAQQGYMPMQLMHVSFCLTRCFQSWYCQMTHRNSHMTDLDS